MSYNVSSVNLFSASVDKWLNLVYNLDTNGILYKWRYDMTIIPMRDLKDTVAIEKKCAEANGPVFVTKNGYGRLVVMDIEYYEKTLSKIYEANLLNEGLTDLQNEKVVDGEAVRERIAKKYGG